VSAELSSVDHFVLNALLDDVESAESILVHGELPDSPFTTEEVEESLRRMLLAGLVVRVEFDQESKLWQKFDDYKKHEWFDLTEEGRSVALQNSAK
jgi:hypothetical protein